jgi:hypothetical protein
MQILLNTDPYVDGREAMVEHLESVVMEVLGQFGTRILCVEAYLSDANGANQARPKDIHCTLAAQSVGLEPVVARHHAGTAHQAVHGALRKLGCKLAFEFEKHDQPFVHPGQTTAVSAQAVA